MVPPENQGLENCMDMAGEGLTNPRWHVSSLNEEQKFTGQEEEQWRQI